jgi:hypothetical protein
MYVLRCHPPSRPVGPIFGWEPARGPKTRPPPGARNARPAPRHRNQPVASARGRPHDVAKCRFWTRQSAGHPPQKVPGPAAESHWLAARQANAEISPNVAKWLSALRMPKEPKTLTRKVKRRDPDWQGPSPATQKHRQTIAAESPQSSERDPKKYSNTGTCSLSRPCARSLESSGPGRSTVGAFDGREFGSSRPAARADWEWLKRRAR